MLLVGYCYGIRHERRLCQEVALHLAYRWFCKLDLDDKVPHHSTFSVNRLGRFRESEILRHFFLSAWLQPAWQLARDEFHLAAIVQNLKTMALRLVGPPPRGACAAIA